MTITSKVIRHSKGLSDNHLPIFTMEVRYPRFIHAELMTHRVFSRNAASSRAIKTEKLIADVLADPAMPTFWGKNQPGMSAKEECTASVKDRRSIRYGWASEEHIYEREAAWLKARDEAVRWATNFMNAGYHKQIVNRILEPWAHITVCITSTSWANWFALRNHKEAQPEIRVLAQAMKEAMDASKPEILKMHEWHLPYVNPEDKATLSLADQIKLSVARCASTSYKTVDGNEMTQKRAIALYDRLVSSQPLHASPTEHQAYPDTYLSHEKRWAHPHLHGNFTGYIQYRKTLDNEYVKD